MSWVTYHELKREHKKSKKQPQTVDLTEDKLTPQDDEIVIVKSTPGKKNKPSGLDLPENPGLGDESLFVPETPTPTKFKKQFSKQELRRLSSTVSSSENNEVRVSQLNQLESGPYCAISEEPFETYYNEQEEEWYAKDCVIMEGKAYHVKNLRDKSLLMADDDDKENEVKSGENDSGNVIEPPMKTAKLENGEAGTTKSVDENDSKRKLANFGLSEPIEVPVDVPVDEDIEMGF